MIQIGPEIFMITTTIFYSFVCIYWTVYCLRIYYHSFESYCVVLSKYQKIMASLPFISCWRKHVFWMIIQIFTENDFFSNVWTADSLNMVDPSFFSFLKDLHADNTLVTNKYTKNIKWVWMGLTDARLTYFSWNRWKIADVSKIGQTHNIWKQQESSFPMRGYSSKSVKWFRNKSRSNWETKKQTSARTFSHTLQII